MNTIKTKLNKHKLLIVLRRYQIQYLQLHVIDFQSSTFPLRSKYFMFLHIFGSIFLKRLLFVKTDCVIAVS